MSIQTLINSKWFDFLKYFVCSCIILCLLNTHMQQQQQQYKYVEWFGNTDNNTKPQYTILLKLDLHVRWCRLLTQRLCGLCLGATKLLTLYTNIHCVCTTWYLWVCLPLEVPYFVFAVEIFDMNQQFMLFLHGFNCTFHFFFHISHSISKLINCIISSSKL